MSANIKHFSKFLHSIHTACHILSAFINQCHCLQYTQHVTFYLPSPISVTVSNTHSMSHSVCLHQSVSLSPIHTACHILSAAMPLRSTDKEESQWASWFLQLGSNHSPTSRPALGGLWTVCWSHLTTAVVRSSPHIPSYRMCSRTTSNYGLYFWFYMYVTGYQQQHLPLSQDHPWPAIAHCCHPFHQNLIGHPKPRLAPPNDSSMQ